MGDALTAQAAVGVFNAHVASHIHSGTGAGILHIPNMQILHLIANLYAAHALDAFFGVANRGEVLIPGSIHDFALKGNIENAQIIGQLLQTAVAAAYAGGTQAIMLGENQLHIGATHAASLGGISIDHQPFLYRSSAGGNYTILSLDFYNANLAGTDFVNVLQKAETRNINTNGGSGLHNRSALGNGNF